MDETSVHGAERSSVIPHCLRGSAAITESFHRVFAAAAAPPDQHPPVFTMANYWFRSGGLTAAAHASTILPRAAR